MSRTPSVSIQESADMSHGVSATDFDNNADWDSAILHAEQEIALIERRRARLKQAIQVFRANKRDGVAWPSGDE